MTKHTFSLATLVAISVSTPARADSPPTCFLPEEARAAHYRWEGSTLCPGAVCLAVSREGQVGVKPPARANLAQGNSTDGQYTIRVLDKSRWSGELEICSTNASCSIVQLVDVKPADCTRASGDPRCNLPAEMIAWDMSDAGELVVLRRQELGTKSVTLETYDRSGPRLSRQVIAPGRAGGTWLWEHARTLHMVGVFAFIGDSEGVVRVHVRGRTDRPTLHATKTSYRMGPFVPLTHNLVAMLDKDEYLQILQSPYTKERRIRLPAVTTGEAPTILPFYDGRDLYLVYDAVSKSSTEYPAWDGTLLRIEPDADTIVGRRSVVCKAL